EPRGPAEGARGRRRGARPASRETQADPGVRRGLLERREGIDAGAERRRRRRRARRASQLLEPVAGLISPLLLEGPVANQQRLGRPRVPPPGRRPPRPP